MRGDGDRAGHGETPPDARCAGQVLEVACDESGSDGENLTRGNTDVFAHASVHLPMESAADHVQEVRDRIRSPAEVYKANHLLREKHRPVLEWLLGPSGPVYGHAYVHLTDKSFLVVDRVVDLLVGDGGARARTLYREGPRAYGNERWQEFLDSCNDLMRTRYNGEVGTPVDSFFHVVDVLSRAGADDRVSEIMALLGRSRSRAESFRAGMLHSPAMIPVLNPLLPAIVDTAAHWSARGRRVLLVHDRQNMLTEERIAWIRRASRLQGLTLVDSREDARVQLADFLAGIARKIASDELNERGDPHLTALLRPYVGASSVWGDDRSAALLRPPNLSPRGARGNSAV